MAYHQLPQWWYTTLGVGDIQNYVLMIYTPRAWLVITVRLSLTLFHYIKSDPQGRFLLYGNNTGKTLAYASLPRVLFYSDFKLLSRDLYSLLVEPWLHSLDHIKFNIPIAIALYPSANDNFYRRGGPFANTNEKRGIICDFGIAFV